jgi:hypothetical protein
MIWLIMHFYLMIPVNLAITHVDITMHVENPITFTAYMNISLMLFLFGLSGGLVVGGGVTYVDVIGTNLVVGTVFTNSVVGTVFTTTHLSSDFT